MTTETLLTRTINAADDEVQKNDDWLTIAAVSILAWVAADLLHEGIGHGSLALLTGVQSGVISTVAWSSDVDSRLVAAGGTLANLAAALVLWFGLRSAKNATPQLRLFLLICFAFNLFTGTGYFCFSGVTNFGDWAVVIAPMRPHWLWRIALVVFGLAAYWGAMRAVATGIVRYVGVAPRATDRMRDVTLVPYLTAVGLSFAAGWLNPVGVKLVFLSALPATAGAQSGLLWLKHYIPRNASAEHDQTAVSRSYAWIATAVVFAAIFIFVFGPGVKVHR
ncbi:MAG TPA: hypothetical protein VF753_08400 [Terriglobales bacterium]